MDQSTDEANTDQPTSQGADRADGDGGKSPALVGPRIPIGPDLRLGGWLGELVLQSQAVAELQRFREGVLRSVLPIEDLLKYRDNVGQQVAALASAGMLETIEQFRKNIAASYQEPMLKSLEVFSRATLGNSMITGDLAAQWANLRVGHILDHVDVAQFAAVQASLSAQIELIRSAAHLVETHNGLLTGLRPPIEVARPAVLATRAWQDVVRLTPPIDSSPYLPRLDIAGRATGWAVHAGVVLTEQDDDELDRIEAEVATSLGSRSASNELRVRLAEIDRRLAEKLDGAWERITEGGADSTSQAANSLMELVDWTLRFLAPNDAVLSWHAAESRPAKELHEGRPTRLLRVRYAVRQYPEKNSSLNLYLKAVQELTGTIQGAKHGLDRNSRKALVPVAMVIEGLLHFLLID